ncbi:MAG: peptidoglycan bridge formation glycyltransferase FemA/FemB family protein [Chloroflexi bacterium]|nr:peptidoglycan bridge formation glycyltransferase FemA/FemB family protein [Chloroflexota bacterium]
MSRSATSAPPSEAWDAFVSAHSHSHVLQMSAWAALKSAHGWHVLRTIADDAHGNWLGGAQILHRNLKFFGRIAYAPRGPVVDWHTDAAIVAALDAASAAARTAGAFALVVEPNTADEPRAHAALQKAGFVPFECDVQPRRSIVVSLAGDEGDILARMKQKTRYNVRLAQKKGVTVRRGDERDADLYYELMRATAARDGFSIHPATYYRDFLRLFTPAAGCGALFIAEADGHALAALIATAVGHEAVYLYGASADAGRELMPTYLLQWEAMRWARERGCTRYDLWGIPDEDEAVLEAGFESRHDGLWGVYRFKRGFGGVLERSIGAWVRPLSLPLWWAYRLALRRTSRHGLAA